MSDSVNIADQLIAVRAPAGLAVLILLLLWETAQPFFPFFGNGGRDGTSRVRHGAVNIGFGVLNGLLIRFVFLALWVRVMDWSAAEGVGLLHWLSLPGWSSWLVAVALLDGWTYGWHRVNHAVRFLWRFHRLHHADRQMDVTTANRFHVGEITLSSLARVPVLALIGCQLEHLALYELLFFAVVQFHHANVAVPAWLDRALRVVIVTPHLHKVHHSVVIAEQNANFGSLFSWWDRLARTFRLAPELSAIAFGVNDETTAPEREARADTHRART